jgi:hypothetical protein
LVSEGHTNVVRDFILDFNKHLEDKMDSDPDLVPFKERIDDIERKSNLLNHLEYTGTLIYKINEMDKKCLADYYIENNAVKADIFDEWDKEDAGLFAWGLPYFDRENEKEQQPLLPASKLVMDSVKSSINAYTNYTLVRAPIGIGKTSLSIYMASVYAQQYLDDSNHQHKQPYIQHDFQQYLSQLLLYFDKRTIYPADTIHISRTLIVTKELRPYHQHFL